TDAAATLWHWIEQGDGDLVITDVMMPDGNGLDLLPRIKRLRPDLRIIVMSAQNTLLTALRANERGAFEYLPKPFDLNELLAIVVRALAVPKKTVDERDEDADDEALPLIGRSQAMQEIYRTMARLVGTDLTVMISGESGTGKELVARALHDYGKRRRGPFVAVNMAAIPRELIESELFGHEKGAFTGATARFLGRFAQANRGTLFLDEIGDMPPEAQTRLLRVLQEGEFTTVGGRESIQTDVRIVAATHRDLRQLIRQGLFREDLFYRLNVVPVRLPPLRERREDVGDLVRHFLAQAAEEGLPQKTVNAAGLDLLRRYDWPGNVRELENMMRRIAALYTDEVIDDRALEMEISGAAEGGVAESTVPADESLSQAVERHIEAYFAAHGDHLPPAGLYERVVHEVERPLLAIALGATRGNQIKAAEMLGINRNTLRKKLRVLDIPVVRVHH
ncbi:MAG: nitrogen regulation protein NR(I), partial [Pseudomonadota bacterium]|nr:nitrogen regulation protein NR(I) [Pseudomonadota bacterium]